MIIRLQVKEGNKNNDKKNVIFVTKASVMEFSQNIKNKKANKIKLDPKGGISWSKPNFKGNASIVIK